MSKIVFLVFALISTSAFAGLSWNNYLDWVVVSSNQLNNSNFIQLRTAISDCVSNSSGSRIRFSRDDANLLSLFLAAKIANKKIGFFYNETTTLPIVSGHGLSTCEIRNAWLETD